MYFRCVPDHFIVQDEIIRSELARLQQFPPERIYVVGFPQFDWYRRPGVIKPREEHLRGKGLDPDRAVIFFGSQGIWFKQDYQVAEQIYQWIKRDELAKPCQLIVRPHFSNVKNTPLQKLKGLEHVSYDDSYHISDVFVDNWDPTAAENTDFANTLRHSDVVVNILSTIALDAACFDRPTINALYGGVYQNGRDVTHKMAEVVHYQWVFATGATLVARSAEELREAINQCLLDPQSKQAERKLLIDRLCYKVDGKSAERIVEVIETVLGQKT